MWHSMKLEQSNMGIIPGSKVLFSKRVVDGMGWTKINVFTEVIVLVEQILQKTCSSIEIVGKMNMN